MRTRRPPFVAAPRSAFAGFRFPPEVIVIAVQWYFRFGLSDRDVEELLVERGVEVDHVTVYRWVLRFTPLLAEEKIAATSVLAAVTPWIAWSIVTACGPADFQHPLPDGAAGGGVGLPPHWR